MIKFERYSVEGAGCELSIVEFGNATQPPVILLHGTHDHALGMLPAVKTMLPDYRFIGLDLRGHGHSDKPGGYTLLTLLADLRALVDTLELTRYVLVGHSLGGVVASAFTAIYPNEVEALVLIDGMGPPALPQPPTSAQQSAGMKHMIGSALRGRRRGRNLQNIDEAKERFTRNNPGLDEDSVGLIVGEGTTPADGGGLCWRFDPSIDLIFSTYHNADIEAILPQVRCPTLLIIGERALDFWRGISSLIPDDPVYFEREQRRREAIFKFGRLIVISTAGHSPHFDAPSEVQTAIEEFLRDI